MARKRGSRQPQKGRTGAADDDGDVVAVRAVAVDPSIDAAAVVAVGVNDNDNDDRSDNDDDDNDGDDSDDGNKKKPKTHRSSSNDNDNNDDTRATDNSQAQPVVVVAVSVVDPKPKPDAVDKPKIKKPRNRSTKPPPKNTSASARRRNRSANIKASSVASRAGSYNNRSLLQRWFAFVSPNHHDGTINPYQRAHVHLGWLRMLLFALLIYEYITYLPHYQILDVAHPSCYDPHDATYNFQDENMFFDTGSDTWLATDWWEWTQHWVLPRMPYAGKAQQQSDYDDGLNGKSPTEPPRSFFIDEYPWLKFQFHVWYYGAMGLVAIAVWKGGMYIVWKSAALHKSQQRMLITPDNLLQQFLQLVSYYWYSTSATTFLFMYAAKLFSLLHLYTDYRYLLLCLGILATALDQQDIHGKKDWNSLIQQQQLAHLSQQQQRQPDVRKQHLHYTGICSWMCNVVVPTILGGRKAFGPDINSKQARRKRTSTNTQHVLTLPNDLQYYSSLQSWSTTTINLLRFQLAVVFTVNGVLIRWLDQHWLHGDYFRLRHIARNLDRLYEHYSNYHRLKSLGKSDPRTAPPAQDETTTSAFTTMKDDEPAYRNDDDYMFPMYPYTIDKGPTTPYDFIQYNTEETWRFFHHDKIRTKSIPSPISARRRDEPLPDYDAIQKRMDHKHGIYHPLQVPSSVYKEFEKGDQRTAWICLCLAQFITLRLWLGHHGAWWKARSKQSSSNRLQSSSIEGDAQSPLHRIVALPWYTWITHLAFVAALGWYYFGLTPYSDSEVEPLHQITTVYFALGFWIWRSFGAGLETSVVWWMLDVLYTLLVEPFRSMPEMLRLSSDKASADGNSSGSGNSSSNRRDRPYSDPQLQQLQVLYKQMLRRKRWYALISLCWIIFQFIMPIRTYFAGKSAEMHLKYSKRGVIAAGVGDRYVWTQWLGWKRSSIITHTGSFIREMEGTGAGSRVTCTGSEEDCREVEILNKVKFATQKIKRELVHKTIQLRLGYMVGMCRGHGMMMQSDYMMAPVLHENIKVNDGTVLKNRYWKELDLRTLPVHQILSKKQWEAFERYPRQWARLGAGMARALETSCSDMQLDIYNFTTYEDARVYGVLFQQINGRGAFSRILDPTMDLDQVDQVRRKIQSYSEIFRSWNSASQWFQATFLDQMPRRYEGILRGIGTMHDVIVEGAEPFLWQEYPHAKAIYVIADRAECLRESPVMLWPNGYPLTLAAVQVPFSYDLFFQGRREQKGHQHSADEDSEEYDPPGSDTSEFQEFWSSHMGPNSERIPLRKFNDRKIVTTSLEIGIDLRPNAKPHVDGTTNGYKCRETTYEDVIWAIIFET